LLFVALVAFSAAMPAQAQRRNDGIEPPSPVVAVTSEGIERLPRGATVQPMGPVPPITTGHAYLGGQVGGGWSTSTFNVAPPFDVRGSGAVGTIYGGYQFIIPGSSIGIGPQIGVTGGDINGSITNPPASPGNTYAPKEKAIIFGEGRISVPIGGAFNSATRSRLTAGAAWWNYVSVNVTAGAASVTSSIDCSCGAYDSRSRVGPTASIGLSVPVTSNLAVVGQVRGIWLPSTTFNIPGAVPVDQSIYTATVGVEWSFGGPR
jgi:opacity protein-like surface antigen